MSAVYVFAESISSMTGIGKVSTIHYQPEKLTEAQKAAGYEVTLPEEPQLKPGFRSVLYVNAIDPQNPEAFYDTGIDPNYYIPVAEYLAMLPLSTRIALKEARATDATVDSFLDIIEASRDDSASKGVNPVALYMQEYYTYFVNQGLMTQAAVDAILL